MKFIIKIKTAVILTTIFITFVMLFSISYADENVISAAGSPININASSAIVMDMETGRVLFEKNAYVKRPIASTTKIMTAILAIENGNLDDEVTVSERACQIWGSDIGLKPGEKLKLRDLLYGLMLNSGNDAAIAIAEHIGGSLENFLDMMNEKARLIGAKNSSFKSPHGLDMEGHYSTAYDLALITRYALANPVFSEIVSTKTASIPGRNLYNTNEMLGLYPGADGVKTGYTGQAGRCLVTSATRNGWRIISVVLNCPTKSARTQNSIKILDYAFNNYKMYTLTEAGETVGYLPVNKGIEESVPIVTTDKIVYPLTQEEAKRVKTKILLLDDIDAPVFGGVDAGYVIFTLDGKVIAETKLKVSKDVAKKDFNYYFQKTIDEVRKFFKSLFSGLPGILFTHIYSCTPRM